LQPPRPRENASNLLVMVLLANSRGDAQTSDALKEEAQRRDAIYEANLKRWKELDALGRGERAEVRSQKSDIVRHQKSEISDQQPKRESAGWESANDKR